MEIGNEISQKIRSAIKAKLVDLGAYVDDELPDYIMVMVANKKTQAQMTEDLNLFLGNNTERFTAWLHALLTKLKAITAESKEVSAPAPEQKEKPPPPISTAEEEPPENDVLTIRAEEADDFDEEERIEKEKPQKGGKKSPAAKSTTQQAELITQKTKIVKTPPKPPPRKPSTSAVSKVSQDSIPKSVVSVKSKPVGRSSAHTRESTRKLSGTASRKRKVPGSVIGSVLKHAYSDDEEEYDPHKPLIGRVASTIKVGERRPSVPASMQANKSLLMKAVTAAQDSIQRSSRRGEAVVRPVQQRLGNQNTSSERRPRASAPLRSDRPLRSATRSSRPSGSRAEEHNTTLQLFSRSKREETLQRLKWQVEGDSEPESSGKDEEMNETGSPGQIDVRTVRCEGTETGEEADVEVEEEEEEEIQERRTVSVQSMVTNKVVEDGEEENILETLIESGAEESDFTDENEAEEVQPQRVIEERMPQSVKERASSPKFVVTLDGVDPGMLKKEIHFDEEDVDMEANEEEYVEEEEDEVDLGRNIVRVKPRVQHVPQVSIRLQEEGDEDEEDYEGGPAKRSKVPERCRFWPACKNGSECGFHHPTVSCKTFPNCNYGDKCLFIHPNCKFDATCTRRTCPYTHASKRSPGGATGASALPIVIQPVKIGAYDSQMFADFETVLPVAKSSFISHKPRGPARSSHPAQVTCKFFPRCTNMSCPYAHPRPCRYGISCTRKSTCPFTHPTLPTKDQLVWTPTKHTTASALSGVTTEVNT